MNYPNIAITAATGTLGTKVQNRLYDNGVPFVAISRNKPENIQKDNFRSADFLDLQKLKMALEGVDTVFFNVPLSPDMEQMTENFVKAALDVGVKRIIKLSVLNADSKSEVNLWKWHGISEDLIVESGIEHLFLRSANFMQNFQNFYGETIRHDGAFYLPHGNAKVNLIDVEDLAEVVSFLLTKKSFDTDMYQLTGHSYTKNEIASIFTNVLGKEIFYVDVPEDVAEESMLDSGMPEWMVEVFMQFNKKCKEGKVDINTDHVMKILGRGPHYFNTYIKNNSNHFIPEE
ncbi:NmrA family NAD(P)-binding protein [Gracilimonas sp.]|uniref:NmrA family NAD(P)-binding protein n=1 Tax=Gracilimonas sp. TaxID=1974203 RepID=UPI0032EC376D